MGETTKIEWADATWNPVIGCAKVSPACTNCYAEAQYKRFGRPELWRGERQVTSAKTWRLPEEVDALAAAEGRRLRMFVASLSDVFEDHPAWLAPLGREYHRVAGVHSIPARTLALRKLARLKHVDVLLLTKRPENILRMVPPEWLDAWPAHIWVGTTAEDQPRAEDRLSHLLRVPAAVRFVSYEPALGPVDFRPWFGLPEDDEGAPYPGNGLSWVIAGGESGPKARPAHPDWFRSVRDQCARAGVPFLFKQWGEWAPGDDVYANGTGWTGMHEQYPEDGGARRHSWHDAPVRETARRLGKGEYPHEVGGDTTVLRVGKKAAGRLLDGVLHDGFPEVSRG